MPGIPTSWNSNQEILVWVDGLFRISWVYTWLPNLLAVWPQASYVNSLGLSFLLFKMESGLGLWSQTGGLSILALASWPMEGWLGSLLFADLSSLICTMGATTVSTLRVAWRAGKRDPRKVLPAVLGTRSALSTFCPLTPQAVKCYMNVSILWGSSQVPLFSDETSLAGI